MNVLQGDITARLPEDNIGGQRSKLDIIATILHICLEGSLKHHILGKGNFSDSLVNHYLSILLYHDMLDPAKTENRTLYRTTEKGRQFINYYALMQGLFKKPPAAENSMLQPDRYQGSVVTGSQSKRTILIVDDESDISSAMKIGLEENGFSVDVFNNPHDALASYRPGYYDLLVLDVKMPQMNGFEMYRKIREVDQNSKVCFLTAFEMYIEEFRRVFPSMDIKHFIQKPISMPDLVSQIRKLTE